VVVWRGASKDAFNHGRPEKNIYPIRTISETRGGGRRAARPRHRRSRTAVIVAGCGLGNGGPFRGLGGTTCRGVDRWESKTFRPGRTTTELIVLRRAHRSGRSGARGVVAETWTVDVAADRKKVVVCWEPGADPGKDGPSAKLPVPAPWVCRPRHGYIARGDKKA